MFTKTLLVLLFACAFTYICGAYSQESESVRRLSSTERLAEELQEIEDKTKHFFDKIGNAFTTWWNRLSGRVSREKKAKLEELKSRYEVLTRESEAALHAKKQALQSRVAKAEENLEKTKADAQIELQSELTKWKVQFEQLQAEADQLIDSM